MILPSVVGGIDDLKDAVSEVQDAVNDAADDAGGAVKGVVDSDIWQVMLDVGAILGIFVAAVVILFFLIAFLRRN
jgi:hypothetical protein